MIELIAIVLLLFAPPHDPQLIARWDGPGASTVQWTQTARSCLYREPAQSLPIFVSCYDGAGLRRIEFGHVGPLSGDLRPTAGDTYVLTSQGQTWRARLAYWRWLAVWRA